MPLFKSIPVEKGLLSVWQITEPCDELLSLFTREELSDPKFVKFTFEKRKAEWLATRALLKQMIGSEFEISYTAAGKPILHHAVYKHISISHSRDFVAVLVHKDQPVGIDIESMKRNYEPIAKRYLSELELNGIKENIQLQCLYWCAKEAIFKLVEDEGIDFRKQIEVIAIDAEKLWFSARYRAANLEITYPLHCESFSHHCMVWVCNNTVNR